MHKAFRKFQYQCLNNPENIIFYLPIFTYTDFLFTDIRCGDIPPPLDTNSNADSGVDDLHHHHHKYNSQHDGNSNKNNSSSCLETVSLISSLSTISSEEDAGVSLTFEPDICNHHKDQHQSEVPSTAGEYAFMSKPLAEWGIDDVGEWLVHQGLGIYVNAFADNEIEGLHLPELGKDELTELGVNRIGHRLTFEKSIKKFVK